MFTPAFYQWEKRLAWMGFILSLLVLALISVGYVTKSLPELFAPLTRLTKENSAFGYSWALRFAVMSVLAFFASAFLFAHLFIKERFFDR